MKKETFPCWVCNEPQDTGVGRLCKICQCATADLDVIDSDGFKNTVLRLRKKYEQ